MRKNSNKNLRLNAEVQRALSEILREVKDPRIGAMTSVVAAEVAPDLKTCKVWVSVLGSDEDRKHTEEGLRAASGYIRRELAHTLNLRNTPELRFWMDESIEYGVRMARRIDEVRAMDGDMQGSEDSEGSEESKDSGMPETETNEE